MPRLKVTAPRTQALRKSLARLGVEIPKHAKQIIRDALESALAKLRKPGSKITYPVKWDSERQRRAYFATDGFGHGIPYRRAGKLSDSWKIVSTVATKNRVGYTIGSNLGYAKYVQGDAKGARQSSIHRNRWQLFADAVRAAIKSVPAKIRAELRIGGRKWQ